MIFGALLYGILQAMALEGLLKLYISMWKEKFFPLDNLADDLQNHQETDFSMYSSDRAVNSRAKTIQRSRQSSG